MQQSICLNVEYLNIILALMGEKFLSAAFQLATFNATVVREFSTAHSAQHVVRQRIC